MTIYNNIRKNTISLFTLTFYFTFMIFPSVTTHAAEIRNIQTGQTARQAYIQYDLLGKLGEKEAEITVTLDVGGKLYNSDRLNLSGDFGKKITIGISKRIWWDILKDMTSGFSGEVIWNIETAEILSDDFFEVTSKTVLDRSSGLVWAKLGKYSTEKFSFDRARGFISLMNKMSFGGFNDWRIPSETEMMSLFKTSKNISNQAKKTPFTVLLQYFKHLENWRYWVDAPRGFQNWPAIDLETGDVAKERNQTVDNCILPVRSKNDKQGFEIFNSED